MGRFVSDSFHHSTTLGNHTRMPHGQKISPDVQWIVIRLSRLLRKEQIAIYTGVSIRSIERILEHFQKHGTVAGLSGARHNRRKQLRDIDIEVSIE